LLQAVAGLGSVQPLLDQKCFMLAAEVALLWVMLVVVVSLDYLLPVVVQDNQTL
jgi:hypothetical protein